MPIPTPCLMVRARLFQLTKFSPVDANAVRLGAARVLGSVDGQILCRITGSLLESCSTASTQLGPCTTLTDPAFTVAGGQLAPVSLRDEGKVTGR